MVQEFLARCARATSACCCSTASRSARSCACRAKTTCAPTSTPAGGASHRAHAEERALWRASRAPARRRALFRRPRPDRREADRGQRHEPDRHPGARAAPRRSTGAGGDRRGSNAASRAAEPAPLHETWPRPGPRAAKLLDHDTMPAKFARAGRARRLRQPPAGKIRRVLIEERIVSLCDHHAARYRIVGHAAAWAISTRCSRKLTGRRTLLSRRAPLDRRVFPARPEGPPPQRGAGALRIRWTDAAVALETARRAARRDCVLV